jgi:hypothetical protein
MSVMTLMMKLALPITAAFNKTPTIEVKPKAAKPSPSTDPANDSGEACSTRHADSSPSMATNGGSCSGGGSGDFGSTIPPMAMYPYTLGMRPDFGPPSMPWF